MSVLKCRQPYSQLFARLLVNNLYQTVCPLQAIFVRLYVIGLARAFYLYYQILLKQLNVSEIDYYYLSYSLQQKPQDYLRFVKLRLRFVIVGNKYYMSLYCKHIPILLKAVLEANCCNLYPIGRLSAYNINVEEKQLSKSIELL